MANDDHVALLEQGVAAWNAWRKDNAFKIRPNLRQSSFRGADLRRAIVKGADFYGANLVGTNLSGANLAGADLGSANLSGYTNLSGANLTRAKLYRAAAPYANLSGAKLIKALLDRAILVSANFRGANLSGATLIEARLTWGNLIKADLRTADLRGADLREANFTGANLSGAYLSDANFTGANLTGASLTGAILYGATLVKTDLTDADLTGCSVHGVSAWRLKLEGTKQQNLIITDDDEPAITVDNIEVAQFIYLMLHNEKVRDVIDTITSKAVLILGRFTDARKAVLDALREELRKRDYLPILFDFDKPRSRDTDETITLLARMARFIVADISDAKAVLQELRAIVPDLPSVPVQPIILAMQEEPGMFDFYRNRPSFLTVHRYATQKQLLADLGEKVIRPAELKVLELRGSI
jgi:uncharacterized protein YjbI with pentapeptide repeats